MIKSDATPQQELFELASKHEEVYLICLWKGLKTRVQVISYSEEWVKVRFRSAECIWFKWEQIAPFSFEVMIDND